MKRRLCAIIAVMCALLPPVDALAAPADAPKEISAEHAVLIECDSGRVLYEKAADERAFMASTTKIMTALLTLEHCALDEIVTVPDAAVGVEGSNAYLARGERLTVNDLLYALMLVSGNDAAVTLATHVAGGVPEFAALMNARAEALACAGTHFANPNGLPDEAHYTTARDLATISAAAMQNPAFRKIVGATYHEAESGDRPRTFKNKNKVLWQYEGGCGVKTGFTKAAGRCLVFAAERDGMTVLGCVLRAPDMWEDACALLDYGFDTLARTLLVDAERPLTEIAVAGSAKKRLAVYPICDILYPLRKDGSDVASWELRCEASLDAPVRAGTPVGTLVLFINGAAVSSTKLIVTESAQSERLADRIYEIIARFIA